MMVRRVSSRLFAFSGAALFLAACGHPSAGSSQVAVKVNRDEITVLQLNQQIQRLPGNLSQEQRDTATRRVISGLIDQQLLVQQALDHKLDRDPEVLGALELARQQMLAQAYVQRVLAAQAKPSEQEIKQYYNENPALFGERKVYQLQELTIQGPAEKIKALQEHGKDVTSLRDLAVWLKANKLAFNVDSAVRTAEQLPMERLAQIARMKDGEVKLFRVDDNRAAALQVMGSQLQPVDDKQAAPVIEQFLSNRKRDQLAQEEVKRLRAAAKIDYVGDFAKYASASTPDAAAAQAAAAPAAAPVANANAGAAPASSTEKGIAGLR